MIVGKFVNADLDISGTCSLIDFSTKSGREYALKRFEQPVDTVQCLENIQNPIIKIRKEMRANNTFIEKIDSYFKEISFAEDAVNEIINIDSMDKRLKETNEQVYFKPGTFGDFINKWGSVVEAILFWKTIFLPGFAILTPFLVIILPFILLRNIFNTDISVMEYTSMIKNIMLANVPSFSMGQNNNTIGQMAKYVYILMSAGVFVSNIVNQVQAAIHLRTVAADIRERGNKIRRYVNGVRDLATLLKCNEGIAAADSVGFTNETTDLGAFGKFYNDSVSLKRLREWTAEYDLYITLAKMKGICFPRGKDFTGTFELNIKDLYHPTIAHGKRVLNSVEFSKEQKHILITGPNRGGKSTMCKSIGFAIMCAQSWGIAFAKSMDFVPISRFETALAPADTLGRMSLFEAEIEFAKHILSIADNKLNGSAFIIMDEIFHSTNAHDGAEASHIFLKQLYEKGGTSVGSLISTHYRELPDKLAHLTRPYCMGADDTKEDNIVYSYRFMPGISTISSVREILRERGLLPPKNSL